MVNLIKAENIKKGEKVLLFVQPSYAFYTLLFACIYYGVNVVVLDSYNRLNNIKKVMLDNGIERVFCNDFTRLLKGKFSKTTKFCNVSKYKKYSAEKTVFNSDLFLPVLTTFTSGTTGNAKAISRNTQFLKEQINAISKNICIDDCNRVYASLPIYVLFVIYSGKTCVLWRKITPKMAKSLSIDTVIAPIARVLKLNKPINEVSKVFLGGAKIYKSEAFALRNLFPKAKITYVYGATECALIALTDLDYYLQNGGAIEKIANGINLSIENKDKNSVGVITVSGSTVVTSNNIYQSNDLGVFDEKGLKIVGRSKYSVENLYNYQIDEKILKDNPKVKRGFSFVLNGKVYFCYQGKLSTEEKGIIYFKFKRLPMDAKHKTKLNYGKMIEILKRKGYIG